MLFIDDKKINRFIKLKEKWTKYKCLRGYPKDCKKGHVDFLTMHQREVILDQLFFLIFDEKR